MLLGDSSPWGSVLDGQARPSVTERRLRRFNKAAHTASDLTVPLTTNQAERDLRMIKTQMNLR